MATNEPLKPCPCCGSKAEFRYIDETDDENCGGHFIECTNPGCAMTTNLRFANGEDPKPLLVEQWNRRPAAIPTGEPTLRELSARQWDWVERMGWHNKTHLEALALISSEVGEAVNECRGEEPTEKYGTELADIILRTLDEAKNSRIDITAVLLAKMKLNDERGTRGRRI